MNRPSASKSKSSSVENPYKEPKPETRSFFQIVLGVLVLLVLLSYRVMTAECAIEKFDYQYVLPKNAQEAGHAQVFERGTSKNMNIKANLGVDLKGIWWMDGNALKFEQLISFAMADGEKPFPVEVPVYTSLPRHWSYSDDWLGRGAMAYYAFFSNVMTPSTFRFQNSTSANILPVSGIFENWGTFGFHKINNNEWDRPDASNIMRRIINADGSKGPFWQKFTEWYTSVHPNGNMLVWSSDRNCLRRCQYLMPCGMCKHVCRFF